MRVLSQLSGGAIQLSDAKYPDGKVITVIDHAHYKLLLIINFSSL
jgi:hypothetical protein